MQSASSSSNACAATHPAGVCRGEHGPDRAPSAQLPADRVDASVVLVTGRAQIYPVDMTWTTGITAARN